MNDRNFPNRGRGQQRRGGWNPGQRQAGPNWGAYNQVGREWQQGRPGEWQEQVEDTFDLEGDEPLGSRLLKEDIAARRGFDERRRREEYDPGPRSSGRGYREEDAPFMRSYPENSSMQENRPVGQPYYAEPRAGMSRGRTQVPAGRGRGPMEGVPRGRGPAGGLPRGPFTGVGPENYTRSDERIQEDVSERLARAGELDASGIRVTVQGGEVTLSGTVPEKEDKWEAEDIAEAVTGVKDVINRLRYNRGLGERIRDAVKGVLD